MSGSVLSALQPAVSPVAFTPPPAAPQPPPQTGATGPTGPVSVPQQIVQGFTQAGYPPVVAQGIARRAGFEGGGDPAKLGDTYTSLGLFQEHGPRMQGLLNYAAQTKQNPLDPKTQVNFAQQEIDKDPALKARLMNAKTPEEAYDIFTRGFENPKDPNDHGAGGTGITMPGTGQLPPWMMSGGSREDNIFRNMLTQQFGERTAANAHLNLAEEAERQMMEAAPKPVATPPAQQWGSIAMAVAALGGLLTHTPITTAFNAAAGVLNAFKKGDMDAASEQFQQWKTSHDAALKMADLEIKQYEAAIKSAGAAPREAQAEMAALTASYKNDYANKLWNEGKTDEALAVHAGFKIKVDDMGNAGKNFEAQAKLAVANKIQADHPDWDKSQVYLEAERQMHGAASTGALEKDQVKRMLAMEHPDWDEGRLDTEAESTIAGAKTKGRLDAQPKKLVLNDAAVDMEAKSFLMTGKMPAMGMGSGDARVQILNRAGQLAKEQGHTVDDYITGQAAWKADAASLGQITKIADAVQGFEKTALANMEIARGLMNKGAGAATGPVVNRWLQAGKLATGDPDVAAFNTAMGVASSEYGKVISGGSASIASTPEGARAEAQEWLNKIQSPDALEAQFDVARRDMANRKNSLFEQRAIIEQRIRETPGSGNQPGAGDAPALPEAARAQLQPGHETTFQNGQVWTIGPDGQPQRVK